MRDINTAILKAYYNALTGITYNATPIPVYSGILPDNINPNNYVIFGEVSNNDLSTKSSADTNTLMRVNIHTYSEKYNSPIIANSIAGQVFDRVYQNSQFNLPIDDNFQIYSTELVSDSTNVLTLDAGRAYIDRIIIFRHRILH